MPTTSTQIAEIIIIPENMDQTGEHPDTVHIPEGSAMFALLPILTIGGKHPREIVDVMDVAGQDWTFAFVFDPEGPSGKGRGVYLLTGISGLLNAFRLKTGDTLVFEKVGRNILVGYRRVGGAVSETVLPGSDFTSVDGAGEAGTTDNSMSGDISTRRVVRRVLRLRTRPELIQVD